MFKKKSLIFGDVRLLEHVCLLEFLWYIPLIYLYTRHSKVLALVEALIPFGDHLVLYSFSLKIGFDIFHANCLLRSYSADNKLIFFILLY